MLKEIYSLLNEGADTLPDDSISNGLNEKIEFTEAILKDYRQHLETFYFKINPPLEDIDDIDHADIEVLKLLLAEKYTPPEKPIYNLEKQKSTEIYNHLKTACFCYRLMSETQPPARHLMLKLDLAILKLSHAAILEKEKMIRDENFLGTHLSKRKNRPTARKMILESLKKGTKIRTSTVQSRLKKQGIVRASRTIRDDVKAVKNFLDQRESESYLLKKKENERYGQKLAADYVRYVKKVEASYEQKEKLAADFVRHIKKLEASYGQKTSSKSDDI